MELQLGEGEIGLGGGDGGLGLGDALGGAGDAGAGDRALGEQIGGVENRHHLTLLDHVAFPHPHLGDASGEFGGDVDARHLDAAVGAGHARGQTIAAVPTPHRPAAGDEKKNGGHDGGDDLVHGNSFPAPDGARDRRPGDPPSGGSPPIPSGSMRQRHYTV